MRTPSRRCVSVGAVRHRTHPLRRRGALECPRRARAACPPPPPERDVHRWRCARCCGCRCALPICAVCLELALPRLCIHHVARRRRQATFWATSSSVQQAASRARALMTSSASVGVAYACLTAFRAASGGPALALPSSTGHGSPSPPTRASSTYVGSNSAALLRAPRGRAACSRRLRCDRALLRARETYVLRFIVDLAYADEEPLVGHSNQNDCRRRGGVHAMRLGCCSSRSRRVYL